VEIGTHSAWISRPLRELVHEVIVTNARKVRLIGESRYRDFATDMESRFALARVPFGRSRRNLPDGSGTIATWAFAGGSV
jgi:hypothetical protein